MILEDCQIEQENQVVVVTIKASQCSGVYMQELMEELTQRMRFDRAMHFVLDVHQVEYIDSSCIGALVSFLQELEPIHGRLALVNCQPNVQFLFNVTRLDSVFEMFDDLDKARQALLGAAA